MNKLFNKIGVAFVGIAMAIGVGFAVGSNGKKTVVANAESVTVTWSRVTSESTLLSGGTFIFGHEATANSGVIVPIRNYGTATTSAAGFLYSGVKPAEGDDASNSSTINMASVTVTSDYEFTVTASSVVDGAINIMTKYGNPATDVYVGNTNTKNNLKLFAEEANTTAFTPTKQTNDKFQLDIEANNSDNKYRYLKYNSGSPRGAVYASGQNNLVAYKKITITKYSLTYNANGGTGTMTDSESPYVSGSTVTVKTNSFSAPDGKRFLNWNTADDGTGTSYVSGNTFALNTDTILYAQWEDIPTTPYITLNLDSISAYTVDSGIALTATPSNFKAGEVTYVWGSDDEDVATVSESSTNSTTVSFIGRGTATITVSGYVGEELQASETCEVNVTKTRNVNEQTAPKIVYDFSSLTTDSVRSASDIASCLETNDFDSAPSITPTNVYGNSVGGARIATGSKDGSLVFDFDDQPINHVKLSLRGWGASEGEMTVTNYATTLVPASTTPQSYEFDLSANTYEISLSSASGKRTILKSVEFSYKSTSNVSKTADVVGLENFIDTYLRSDLAYNADPDLPVNQTTECESLYPAAKAAFNGTSGTYKLNNHQRLLFTTNSAYANELARLETWAAHTGDSLNADTHVLEANHGIFAFNNFAQESSAAIIITIISMVGVIAIGGYFFIRKRKEQ